MREITIDTIEEIKTKLNNIVNDSKTSVRKHKFNVYVSAPNSTPTDQLLLETIVKISKNVKSSLYALYYPNDTDIADEQLKFKKNITALYNCDVLVALITNASLTTAIEINTAVMLGKRVILVGYSEDDFTYAPNKVFTYLTSEKITLDKFAKFLQGSLTNKDYIKK